MYVDREKEKALIKIDLSILNKFMLMRRYKNLMEDRYKRKNEDNKNEQNQSDKNKNQRNISYHTCVCTLGSVASIHVIIFFVWYIWIPSLPQPTRQKKTGRPTVTSDHQGTTYTLVSSDNYMCMVQTKVRSTNAIEQQHVFTSEQEFILNAASKLCRFWTTQLAMFVSWNLSAHID